MTNVLLCSSSQTYFSFVASILIFLFPCVILAVYIKGDRVYYERAMAFWIFIAFCFILIPTGILLSSYSNIGLENLLYRYPNVIPPQALTNTNNSFDPEKAESSDAAKEFKKMAKDLEDTRPIAQKLAIVTSLFALILIIAFIYFILKQAAFPPIKGYGDLSQFFGLSLVKRKSDPLKLDPQGYLHVNSLDLDDELGTTVITTTTNGPPPIETGYQPAPYIKYQPQQAPPAPPYYSPAPQAQSAPRPSVKNKPAPPPPNAPPVPPRSKKPGYQGPQQGPPQQQGPTQGYPQQQGPPQQGPPQQGHTTQYTTVTHNRYYDNDYRALDYIPNVIVTPSFGSGYGGPSFDSGFGGGGICNIL
jgi:outer membrane biosynthesis protein TonB